MTTPLSLFGKRIVVVGLGKSGVATARFCFSRGARAAVTDDLPAERLTSALALLDPDIDRALGGISPALLSQADWIVLSPGVARRHPAITEAIKAGIPVVAEVEFASWFIDAPIVGITGTNGKSTVTSLCGAIAAETGRPTFCGGNLGTPLIQAAGTPAALREGIVVCELSSFQLESIVLLRCQAATVLNLTPDHLDRYDSFEAYGDAKARIFENQLANDVLVLNADDAHVQDIRRRHHGPSSVFPFSALPRPELSTDRGGWYQDGQLVLKGLPDYEGTAFVETYPLSDLQIIGRHNIYNALAAFLLMRASGLATPEEVRRAARAFEPLPHRMQRVATWNSIDFFDDSKGTNVDAVVAGLAGFPRPFALIAGGRDKGGSYAPLAQVLRDNAVRGVVLIGEAAPLIEKALFPGTRAFHASTMEEAVARATQLCQPGDAVVLSPACSSYDMFRDYAHRADMFIQAIQHWIAQHPMPSTV